MKKRVRLTKNRLKALNIALSLDDVLYAKYERVMEGIKKAEKRLARKGNVIKVIQEKDGNNYILQIVRISLTEDGQVVFVR